VKTLSIGKANGAISILHSLGLGKGSSIGIELITEVSIVDEKREVKGDYHNLLGAVESCWRSEGFPIPLEFGWEVQSTIPIGQGLKSSSALASAAFRALNKFAWTGLSVSELADLAVKSQREAGCTVTGSMDDTWASLDAGWKLVDPKLDALGSVILQGEIEPDLSVLLAIRGRRRAQIAAESFVEQRNIFERALASVMSGSPLEALSTNGMAVASATDDYEALRMSNTLIASGAIASGISGSGPSLAVVCFNEDKELLASQISEMGLQVISTRFVTHEAVFEEVF
tara:strand:+ start:447 stop:1304 length:858 start_codon:yes stop_codon:yes gene_type:complete